MPRGPASALKLSGSPQIGRSLLCRAASAPRSRSGSHWPSAPVAAARRAGGSAGPPGKKEVPHFVDRSGRGGRSLSDPVLSPSPRPGKGLRPPRPARRVPGQICDDIEHILGTHRMLVGPRRKLSDIEPGLSVVKATQTANQTRLLVRTDGPVLDPSWQVDEVGLEDIVLGLHEQGGARSGRPPRFLGCSIMNQLIWRLHYRQVYWALATLAALAVLLVVTGINMANDYRSFQATCAATQSCGDVRQYPVQGRWLHDRPRRLHPRHIRPVRHVLGCALGRSRVRGGHPEPGLDAGGYPAESGSA